MHSPATPSRPFQYDSDGDAIMHDVVFELPDQRCLQLSPIFRLSDDVLYELVMSLVGEPSRESFKCAVRLAHVCRLWRSIVVHGPLFWRYIPWNRRDSPETVESFLRLSQDRPVTLALKPPVLSNHVVDVLGRHSRRVSTLILTVADFLCLSSALAGLSTLRWTSLERYQAVVKSDFIPGTFTAISSPAKPHSSESLPRYDVPIGPSNFSITTLSFNYTALRLDQIFRLIETAQPTLQCLKLYFQGREGLIPRHHWRLIHGPTLDLPALRSMELGYDDALSLIPLISRIRLPHLESLSLHDFGSAPAHDTPKGIGRKHIRSLHPGVPRLTQLLTAVIAAIPIPSPMTALRLTHLYDSQEPASALVPLLATFGPRLRSLHLSNCASQDLRALGVCMSSAKRPWRKLERLVVHDMDYTGPFECLWVRQSQKCRKLKELDLKPYLLLPAMEVLECFAETVKV
ncbi:hypothetical protein FB45DRAFT_900364 [Roridomyces roridus]|uniref:F-box domain-containing protein n=1 Tax=Roridomyces roridus TaxID=1738132 RepID=A0AAD7C7M4_9AGAR|nr:hypothetical protein FB45DRAFT_900364 [Roridomyces roridus]